MRRSFIIIFIILQIMAGTLFAQVVYTPRKTAVEVNTYSAGDIASLEYEAAYYIASRGWSTTGSNPDIIKTAPATGAYNCHSYAWYMTEGGSSIYWMNPATKADYQLYYNPEPKNIKKYWEDGSYVEVAESNATKVFYGSCWSYIVGVGYRDLCDHSAIRITEGVNTGKYESKWGAWPRYIHPADKSPYSISGRKYYVRAPIISGSTLICSGSPQTFSAEHWQSGYYWAASSNLTLSSPATNSTVTVSGNVAGRSWLYIMSGTMELAAFKLWVGIPTMSSIIDGSSTAVASKKNTYYTSALPQGDFILWTVSPSSIIERTYMDSFSPELGFVDIVFTQTGSQWVEAKASNACGTTTSVRKYVTVTGLSFDTLMHKIYPNPATDILHIEILNQKAITQTQFSEQTIISGATLSKTDPTYDIRLYDGQGNLLRQVATKGGKVEFNVVNLPVGIYYLHIYDGVSSTPEIRQIVVER